MMFPMPVKFSIAAETIIETAKMTKLELNIVNCQKETSASLSLKVWQQVLNT